MIQNIQPHKLDNAFTLQNPMPDSLFFSFREGKVLLVPKEDGSLALPSFQLLDKPFVEIREQALYLFSVDEIPLFLLMEKDIGGTGNMNYHPMNMLFSVGESWTAFAGVTASQLDRWYETRVYCGKCGAKMEQSMTERALLCRHCGTIEYPKICPVIMAGVVNEDRLLLTRYADRPFKRYGLVAGFVEIGESLEEALKREVMEEVGLAVKELFYYGSQPWGFSDSIISGYFAKLDGPDTISVDHNELAEAVWCSRDELPDELGDISITHDMIEAFRKGNVKF